MVHTKTNPASHPNTRPITFTERDAKCNSCCHKQEDQQQLSFLSVLNHSLVVRMHERGVSVKKFPGFLTKLVLSRIDGAAEAVRLQSRSGPRTARLAAYQLSCTTINYALGVLHPQSSAENELIWGSKISFCAGCTCNTSI